MNNSNKTKYPSYEDIYQWYIVEDGSYADASKHFGISRWKFEDLCRKYGIRKDRKKTCKKSVATREKKAGGKEAYNKQLQANRKQSIIEKYGSLEEFMKLKGEANRKAWEKNHDYILNKINNTKQQNHSFHTSNVENDFYLKLIDKYGTEDVIRQYSDDRYPFKCDFYIKSKDLFIELNLSWTHGGHPFDPNNEEDIQSLDFWKHKSETSNYYKNAIYTWTELDVRKWELVNKNNLNYLALFNMLQVEEWLNANQ